MQVRLKRPLFANGQLYPTGLVELDDGTVLPDDAETEGAPALVPLTKDEVAAAEATAAEEAKAAEAKAAEEAKVAADAAVTDDSKKTKVTL